MAALTAGLGVSRGGSNLLGARAAPFTHNGLRRALRCSSGATLRCGPLRAGRGSKLQVGWRGLAGVGLCLYSRVGQKWRAAFCHTCVAPIGVLRRCGVRGSMHASGDRCDQPPRHHLPPPPAAAACGACQACPHPSLPPLPSQVVSKHSAVPEAQGLFNPENDKDACGVGFVAGEAPLPIYAGTAWRLGRLEACRPALHCRCCGP